MKKFTTAFSFPLFTLLALTTMLFFSACSSNKQYFSFSPAPAAYVKKQAPAPAETIAATENQLTENTSLTASTAPDQAVILPEISALKAKAQPALANSAKASLTNLPTTTAEPAQKLTLAQKVMLHKIQKQAKKLSKQSQKAESAAGPVSNRNAISLILIGLIVAVLGSFLGGLFYTLGVLILLVGLVLLVLNYV